MAVDLFCGAGGTSTGLLRAASAAGYGVDLLAINHWELAIATHASNHPGARHLCESLDVVDPRKVCVAGGLDVLVASPECTHHSVARGGRPVCDQSRASAWHVVRWAEALRPRWILVENVKEFGNWGPIGANGRPLQRYRGETYLAFLQALRSLGYTVDDRVLNAADYGDPTTRERLFVVARLGYKHIPWPVPTHARRAGADMPGTRKPWRAAREVIDWSFPGTSIFRRRRPLALATMRRIAAGLHRFGGSHVGTFDPFLVPFFGERAGQAPRTRSLDEPMPAVTGQGAGGLVQPFLLGQQSGGSPRSVDEPTPTVSTRGAISLVQPFLVSYYSTGHSHSVSEPAPTITTKDRLGLVQPQHVDILFRMLQPRELAAAMGFPVDYRFSGTKSDQVRQIGNAVCVGLAEALFGCLLGSYRPAR